MNTNKVEKIVARALYNAQDKMPPAQNWNLSSKAACEALAKTVSKQLVREAKKDDSLYLELY